jgi:hypothetical protein
MIIPEKMKVGGKTYTVVHPHNFTEQGNLVALCDNETNTIRVRDTALGGDPMSRQNVEEAFLHEIIHAVDLIYNGAKLKEETVKQLAQGLYQVLTDNGMLAQ